MRIKKGFVIEKVAGSYLACATGELAKDFSGFIRLNESGAFLWNILANGADDEAALVSSLAKNYAISEELASKDAGAFLKILRDNGILEE